MIPRMPITDFGNQLCTDYEGKCGNCHKSLSDGDRYCRHCGTRRGEGKFEPYMNLMQCIYGPLPVKRTHTCPTCRTAWVRELMIDNEIYCPHCGGRVVIQDNTALTSTLDIQWNRDFQVYTSDPFREKQYNQFGQKFPSDSFPEIKIGRSPAADLKIPNNRVSREHALIVFENNQWFLRDTGSSNGTTLNGYPLTPYVNVPLSDRNIIVFAGSASIVVQFQR